MSGLDITQLITPSPLRHLKRTRIKGLSRFKDLEPKRLILVINQALDQLDRSMYRYFFSISKASWLDFIKLKTRKKVEKRNIKKLKPKGIVSIMDKKGEAFLRGEKRMKRRRRQSKGREVKGGESKSKEIKGCRGTLSLSFCACKEEREKDRWGPLWALFSDGVG